MIPVSKQLFNYTSWKKFNQVSFFFFCVTGQPRTNRGGGGCVHALQQHIRKVSTIVRPVDPCVIVTRYTEFKQTEFRLWVLWKVWFSLLHLLLTRFCKDRSICQSQVRPRGLGLEQPWKLNTNVIIMAKHSVLASLFFWLHENEHSRNVITLQCNQMLIGGKEPGGFKAALNTMKARGWF